MSEVQLKITGMTCGHCVAAVSKALKSVPGVQDAQVELAGGSARVQGSANAQALVKAVQDEGYTAQVLG
jgi:copper chaperone CopZ